MRERRGAARRRVMLPLAGAGLAVLAVASLTVANGVSATAQRTGAADDSPSPAASLPAPTGGHPVGTSTLHLVDRDRADIWDPDAEARELMVTLWYPVRAAEGERAPYLTSAESAATVERLGLDLPGDALAEIGTNAFVDAPVRRTRTGSPLVLLSPGAGLSRTSMTTLAEDLAGNGFVVAGIDHANEAGPVEFPDGRILECTACGQDRWEEGAANRAADVGFVLDELTGNHPAWRGASAIDPSRVGMAGHSAGGSATAEAMRVDDRVDAGLNFDGPYFTPALEEGVDRPLGLVTSDPEPAPPFHESQQRMWPALTGWRQWLRLEDSGHASSTDRGVLIERLDVRDQVPPDVMLGQFGTLPTERGLDIARDYTTGFFTHHLRGESRPVVLDPASVHPELVVVEQP